jgi:hypothetical protein
MFSITASTYQSFTSVIIHGQLTPDNIKPLFFPDCKFANLGTVPVFALPVFFLLKKSSLSSVPKVLQIWEPSPN